jgi:alkyl sulfatase BDS1-like metallo-beta-lactamase superfamily hydrolase
MSSMERSRRCTRKQEEAYSILCFLLNKGKTVKEISFETVMPEHLVTKWINNGAVSHQGANAIMEVYG